MGKEYKWNINQLAQNPNITYKDILENKDIFKDNMIHDYCSNKNLNIKHVLTFKDSFTKEDWMI